MITKAHNPVKIRYRDSEYGNELNLGGGLSAHGDPVFATPDDAIHWLAAQQLPDVSDGLRLDRRNDYVIVPAWVT